MLTLVRHQPSGDVYVLRQAIAGHCLEISGPLHHSDYRLEDGSIEPLLAIDFHNNQIDVTANVEWADGEQWTVVRELEL